MGIELWLHQQRAVETALSALGNGARGLWVLPTGTGKTIAFASLAREMGDDTPVVVHREELARQAVRAFEQVWPAVKVAWFGEKGWDEAPVVVATVQKLARRLDQIPRDRFGLVVIDEAHHSTAASWDKVIHHFQPRLVLGCTATPKRLDGEDLTKVFGAPLYEYPLARAMDEGYLVPVCQHAIHTSISLAEVGQSGRDFSIRSLGPAVAAQERTRAVVDGYLRHAPDRPALVFAVDLAHVEQLRAEFASRGISVASVTGRMKSADRQQVLEDFCEGRLRVLVNCEVLTEGYDERRVSCIVMARPTQSLTLYTQAVGRGLRIHPDQGKRDCLVLDVVDLAPRQRVMVATNLFGARVPDCCGMDAREAARIEKARWALEPVSPTAAQEARWDLGEDTVWQELPDLRDYSPGPTWHGDAATGRQMDLLARLGFESHRPLTKGEVSHLIDRCHELDERYPTPATPNQMYLLRGQGCWRSGMSKREAQRVIGGLQMGTRR
jgi:superfamily II DNA or RNA helicase